MSSRQAHGPPPTHSNSPRSRPPPLAYYGSRFHEAHDLLLGYLVFATAISLLEIAAKIVAHGLLRGKNAFLKSGWNQLDAIIAILCATPRLEPTPRASSC